MEPTTYAVHTGSCTFLLDEEGICRWIVSRTGVVPPEIRGTVGAQFVASMHPELDGLLAGELVVGAVALFVKADPTTAKLVLMRTGTIVHVEHRRTRASVPPPASTDKPRGLSDDTLDLAGGPPLSSPPSSIRGGDTVPPPAWAIGTGEYEEMPVSQDTGLTVTLTLPLFRADAPRKIPPR